MNLATLLAAMLAVESGGDDSAMGDRNRARGALQIHKGCLLDVNRVYGTNFRWPEDCHDREKAKSICVLYLKHWCGPNASPEVLSRTWVGGPNGPRRKSTLKYWLKIQRKLSE